MDILVFLCLIYQILQLKKVKIILALEYLAKAAQMTKNLSKKINDFAILKSGYIMLEMLKLLILKINYQV